MSGKLRSSGGVENQLRPRNEVLGQQRIPELDLESRDLPHVVIVGYAKLMKASRSATNTGRSWSNVACRPLALERVLQSQFTQRHLGLIYFLRRHAIRRGDLNSKCEFWTSG